MAGCLAALAGVATGQLWVVGLLALVFGALALATYLYARKHEPERKAEEFKSQVAAHDVAIRMAEDRKRQSLLHGLGPSLEAGRLAARAAQQILDDAEGKS
jgi:hypothetical protein